MLSKEEKTLNRLKLREFFDKLPQHPGKWIPGPKIHAGVFVDVECPYELRDSPGGPISYWTCCKGYGDDLHGCIPDPAQLHLAHWSCCNNQDRLAKGCCKTGGGRGTEEALYKLEYCSPKIDEIKGDYKRIGYDYQLLMNTTISISELQSSKQVDNYKFVLE